MEYTPEEQKLIEYIRKVMERSESGFIRVSLIIYGQHGKLIRAETKTLHDIPEEVDSCMFTG